MNPTYKIQLSENQSFYIVVEDDGSYRLDGQPTELDAVRTGPDTWNVLHRNKSYNIRLVSFDKNGKALVLSINDEEIEVKVSTELDELLDQMGMSADTASKMVDVKAPMPGLVLDILVEEGSSVSEGDALIILEAMKMENIIKATGDGVVSKILVSNQDAVEKNQVLIEME